MTRDIQYIFHLNSELTPLINLCG